MFNRDKVEALLETLGMEKDQCIYWANILGKKEQYNFFPDCEVRSYLRLFRNYLDNDYERRWSRHSYAACFYMWKELADIWAFRKATPWVERQKRI